MRIARSGLFLAQRYEFFFFLSNAFDIIFLLFGGKVGRAAIHHHNIEIYGRCYF